MKTYDFDQDVNRLDTDSAKWNRYDSDVIPLWVADMDFPSPDPVVQALSQRVEHGVFGYGMEPSALRPLIVERLRHLYDWHVVPEALVFVPGVVAGFNLATRAVATPGDGVLVQTPVYSPILYAPGNAGCSLDEMQLTQTADGNYRIDYESFKATITGKTRIFILCNPHNPVGRVYSQEELERMAEICLCHGVAICSDEIHCDLIFEGYRHIPIASLAPEIAQRSITLMAPSKTFNVAGLHASVAIIPDQELRDRFKAARAGLVSRPGVMSFTAALAAYRDGQPWLEQVLRYLRVNREFLCQYVSEHLTGVTMNPPEGTYLAWLDCRQAGIGDNPHEFFLQEARVALNDGATFGRGGEGFVRLNFACPKHTLAEALARMGRSLDAINGAVQPGIDTCGGSTRAGG
jgi:cystathionine beta-lyase